MVGTWGLWVGEGWSRSLIRDEAEGDTESGTENTLSAILEYVSFSVEVSKGGWPTSRAYMTQPSAQTSAGKP